MNFVHVAVEAVKSVLSELDLDISIQERPEFYNTALVLLSAPICYESSCHTCCRPPNSWMIVSRPTIQH